MHTFSNSPNVIGLSVPKVGMVAKEIFDDVETVVFVPNSPPAGAAVDEMAVVLLDTLYRTLYTT